MLRFAPIYHEELGRLHHEDVLEAARERHLGELVDRAAAAEEKHAPSPPRPASPRRPWSHAPLLRPLHHAR